MSFFVVTFGAGQLGGFGDYYCIYIVAPDEPLVRKIMTKEWNGKYSMIYNQKEGLEIIKKYNYRVLGGYEIKTEDQYTCLSPDQIHVV